MSTPARILVASLVSYAVGAIATGVALKIFEKQLHAWYWSHWSRPIKPVRK